MTDAAMTDPASPEPEAPAVPGLRLVDLVPLLQVEGLTDDSRLVSLFDELLDLVRAQPGAPSAPNDPALVWLELAEPAIAVAKQVLVESDALSLADPDAPGPTAARAAEAEDLSARREARITFLVATARDGVAKAPERYADTGGLPPF